MNRTLFRTLSALACTTVLAVSCYKENADGDKTSAIYGHWVLDTQTIVVEAAVGGTGSTNRTVVDFTGSGCYLELGVEGASARLGIDFAVAIFSYDADSQRLDFPRGLSVKGDGKTFILAGSYDVTELNDKKLVLSQKDIGVSIGSLVDASQTAIYEFHKKEDTAGREERQY